MPGYVTSVLVLVMAVTEKRVSVGLNPSITSTNSRQFACDAKQAIDYMMLPCLRHITLCIISARQRDKKRRRYVVGGR